MFVQTNTLNATKVYFRNKLIAQFSESEIRFMFQMLTEERMKWDRAEILLSGEKLLSESDLLYYRTAAHQLLDKKPFQHIIGSTYFYNLKIKTDYRALVPRPETEELVDWIVQDFSNQKPNVLDICTGSGCIALALKSELENADVSAWDVSNEALQLAKENATLLDLNIDFQHQDILLELCFENKWDVIVSNPPYIPWKEKPSMDSTVTDYDPDLALFVPDNDPLLFYRKIGDFAKHHLSDQGVGYFEIHEDFGVETQELLKEMGFDTELRKDVQGKDRMLKFFRSALQ